MSLEICNKKLRKEGRGRLRETALFYWYRREDERIFTLKVR